MNFKHGKFGTKVYSVWDSMMARCYRPTTPSYSSYGGRGIKVCNAWHKFENFYSDMGDPNGLTLDRIDNEKDYEKSNCRWATACEQANNRRTNVFVEFKGKRQTLIQWSRELGLSYSCIKQRHLNGWPVERMLTCASQR